MWLLGAATKTSASACPPLGEPWPIDEDELVWS
jgi:hypothetical protein